MRRKLTLSIFLMAFAIAPCNITYATTYVWTGAVNTYSLTAADSLFIPSGNFTGTISSFPAGARITIADIATFNPAIFPNTNGNSACGIMNVYGLFSFSSSFVSNTGFVLNNYGIVSLAAVTLRGSNQTWTNNYGAIMNFTDNVLMNGDTADNNVIINYETINFGGNLQMNRGSSIVNYKDINVTGNFRLNGGTFNNEGKMDVAGNILMNNGASVIRNYCKLQAASGITNTAGNFYNYSYVWAKNSDIVNSANIINGVFNHSIPMIHGRGYYHSSGATMTGPALLYFYGTTSMTGGTIGVAGITSDSIKMNDVTRTMPAQIMDIQSGGTRHPNYVFAAWGVPDSTRIWLLGCSIEVILEVPLAINWSYFTVDLINKIPRLKWSAQYAEGTIFEIQRSYDGRRFDPVATMPYEFNRSEYSYDDNSADHSVPFVYYRIKTIEPGGIVKFSAVRIVRFDIKVGSIRISPNPFTSNVVLNYNSAKKTNIVLKIFNAGGQQKIVKSIAVNEGNNRIDINEVGNLSAGLYIVQVIDGSSNIASVKMIKR